MTVEFEVERFEWAADDRLELEGRWFGLRGRRFIRPTLDVEVDGESRRLLALMEHKPWAATDGEDWLAAFAWEGDRGDIDAELAVGPDLSFELPRPDGRARRKASRKRLVAREQPSPEDEVTRIRPPDKRIADLEAQAARVPELQAQAARVPELQAQAARVPLLEDELARLRAELEAERAAATGAADELRPKLAELQRRLDAAASARDGARRQADEATRERYEAQGALAAAERELARAVSERDDLRTSTSAERRELRRERDVAVTERDAAVARLEEIRRERDQARLARDATRAERPQLEGVAEVVRRRGPRKLPWIGRAERTGDDVLALRFAALVALSVVCLLVAIWILLAA